MDRAQDILRTGGLLVVSFGVAALCWVAARAIARLIVIAELAAAREAAYLAEARAAQRGEAYETH